MQVGWIAMFVLIAYSKVSAQYFQSGVPVSGYYPQNSIDMVRTAEGNYIVAATVDDSLFVNNILVADTTTAGPGGLVVFELSPQYDINWIKTYESKYVDSYREMTQSPSGDLFLYLQFNRFEHNGVVYEDVDAPYGSVRGWLHLDGNGEVLGLHNVQDHDYSFIESPQFLNDSTIIFSAQNGIWYSDVFHPFYLNNIMIPSSDEAGHHIVVKYNLYTDTYEYKQFEWIGTELGTGMIYELTVDQEGNIYIAGRYKNELFLDGELIATSQVDDFGVGFLMKLSPDIEPLWIREFTCYTVGSGPSIRDLTIDNDGNLVALSNSWNGVFHVLGELEYTDEDSSADLMMMKYSPEGSLLWMTPVKIDGDGIGEMILDEVLGLDEQNRIYLGLCYVGSLTTGNLQVSHISPLMHYNSVYFLFDSFGVPTALSKVETPILNRPQMILPNAEGSVTIAHYFAGSYTLPPLPPVYPTEDTWDPSMAFLTMINNQDFPGLVSGKVLWDQGDVDCTEGIPMENVVVQANPGDYWCQTDSSGSFSLAIPAGEYTVSPVLNFGIGDLSVFCPDSEVLVSIDTLLTEIDSLDFFVTGELCSDVSVHLSAWDHAWCSSNEFFIYYANNAPLNVENVQVLLDVPTYIELTTSSHPYSALGDGHFLIELGNLDPFSSGVVIFENEIGCEDTGLIGDAACINALILPEDECQTNILWDGSEIEVSGYCAPQGLTEFTITNVGLAMADNTSYYIYLGGDIIQSGQILLDANESIVLVSATTNALLSLVVEQASLYPGPPIAYVILDDCMEGLMDEGISDPDVLLSNNNYDVKCFEIVASYDPNDKQAEPVGIGPEHCIDPAQVITYRIRFQNTGNQDARDVRVIDTLSSLLDPATFYWMGSEHDCNVELENIGGIFVLKCYFDDIMLPDTSAGNAESQGYLEFRVKPKYGLPNGTLIENSAQIYFDYNPPIYTNTTWHTLTNEPKPQTSNIFVQTPGTWRIDRATISVFPNPFLSSFYIFIPPSNRMEVCESIVLTDTYGRKVREFIPMTFGAIMIDVGDLASGVYILKVKTNTKEFEQRIVKY